jgi:Asp-tRNA(Asn)/Glu-tRNA(Gln) amidotransferase A subunit family amidase
VNAKTAPPEATAISALEAAGVRLVDIELPRQIPEWTLAGMLDVEAACVFAPLTRAGDTQGLNAWPGIFQRSHFVSAVDFLHASRARYQLMQQMADVFRQVDLYVGGDDLGISNLTGHPTLALPVLVQDAQPQQRPVCCTLTAGLYDECTLLAVAAVIERHVGISGLHPQLGDA